jgi:AraC-like DNA-binding protein
VRRLAARIGVRSELLLDPRAPLGPTVVHATWSALTASAPPGFGLQFVESLAPSSYGLVGYLIASSDTLHDALTRVVRYQSRAKASDTLVVSQRGDSVVVSEAPPLGVEAWPAALDEAIVGSYLALGRALTGLPLAARAASFPHAAPPAPDLARVAQWLGCAPRYRHPHCEIVLSRRSLDAAITTRDPQLLAYLEPIAARESSRDEVAHAGRVRMLVQRALAAGERPTLSTLARALATTPRSLQRALDAEATTVTALIDDARRSVALALSRNEQLTRGELAALLGYRDSSALTKGLRRLGLSALAREDRALAREDRPRSTARMKLEA